ncbi:MAG: radical SAM protein [Candidatus Pacearchaeota archaeon]|jgi:radical SAM superfamily enzyme YgiQ (UPF0313 family)
MKVLLANPPWNKGDRLGVRAGSRWSYTVKKTEKSQKIPSYVPFPFYLAYATALLEKNKIDVLLIDAIAEGLSDEEFMKRVVEFKPDLFVIETSTGSIYQDLEYCREMKEQTNAFSVLCGPHATVLNKEILGESEFVDFILLGEYEFILLNLVKAMKGKNFSKVKGLVYRKSKKVIVNARAESFDINQLPWPARKFLPMKQYSDTFGCLASPSVQVITSRGCPFNCIFCLWPKIMYGGKNYRIRNPKDVIDEVEFLIKEYGFRSFYFDDDTFNIGKERIHKLCEEIKSRVILKNVKWGAMCRADTCDREMLEDMKNAGMIAIKFGVETADPEVMKKIGKDLDLKKLEETIKICRELEISVHLTFAFGLPGETKESLKKTMEYPIKLGVDSAQFSIVTPFPGTDYFNELEKENRIITKDWSKYDGADSAVFRTENLTQKDLEDALKMANKKWAAYIIKRNLFNPEYYRRLIKNPIGSINYLKELFLK